MTHFMILCHAQGFVNKYTYISTIDLMYGICIPNPDCFCKETLDEEGECLHVWGSAITFCFSPIIFIQKQLFPPLKWMDWWVDVCTIPFTPIVHVKRQWTIAIYFYIEMVETTKGLPCHMHHKPIPNCYEEKTHIVLDCFHGNICTWTYLVKATF
jgi:hypothetical protein